MSKEKYKQFALYRLMPHLVQTSSSWSKRLGQHFVNFTLWSQFLMFANILKIFLLYFGSIWKRTGNWWVLFDYRLAWWRLHLVSLVLLWNSRIGRKGKRNVIDRVTKTIWQRDSWTEPRITILADEHVWGFQLLDVCCISRWCLRQSLPTENVVPILRD